MLSYSEKGSGQPLVLLHAFPLNRYMWDRQLESWSNRHRVVAPDFRGFGESPLGEDESRMESFADDVRDLLDTLKVSGRIILVGLSMGGYVAFEFCRKYPERLMAMVMIATQPVSDSEESRKSRYELAEMVRTRGTEVLIEQMTPRLLGKTTRLSRPDVVETVRRLMISNSIRGVSKACYGLASRRDSTPILGAIPVPVLIVAGAEDPIIPASQLEAMKTGIRQSQLVLIPQSGHLVNLEQPQELDRLVQVFLAGLG